MCGTVLVQSLISIEEDINFALLIRQKTNDKFWQKKNCQNINQLNCLKK